MTKLPNDVARLPASADWTAEQAIAAAAQRGLKGVLILGLTADDEFVFLSSRMSPADDLWLRLHAISGSGAD